jgi:ubiquinone/menaquinone biosynthesis C-methylase UbiE
MNKFLISIVLILLNFTSFAGVLKHWDVVDYEKNAILQQGWTTKFFFQDYNFQGHEALLDIGPGKGNIPAMIANYVPSGKVLALGNSELLIIKSKKDYKYVKNLEFIYEDPQNISFYEPYKEKFDLVTSFTTLHWFKDQETVLQGIYKVLKPRGLCYFKLASRRGDPIQEISDSIALEGHWVGLFKNYDDPLVRYTVGEYASLMEKNGFIVISARDVEDKGLLGDKEKLIRQVKSWLPHYHYLNKNSREKAEEFVNEVVAKYLNRYPPNRNGNIILYDHFLEVIAQKPSSF